MITLRGQAREQGHRFESDAGVRLKTCDLCGVHLNKLADAMVTCSKIDAFPICGEGFTVRRWSASEGSKA